MMDYFVFAAVLDDDGGAVIESLPEGCPADWRFSEGESLAAAFPAGATLKLSSNHPHRRRIRDFVTNVLGLLITSARARAVIESLGVRNAEYLPITIHDHRDNLAAGGYSILNLLGSEDAIDMGRSRVRMNAIHKGQVSAVDELVVNRAGIAPDAKLFRARNMLRLFMIRDDVREAFEEARLSGWKAFPADGWDGLEI